MTAKLGADLVGIGGGGGAGAVGAGDRKRTGMAQELQGQRVIGHAEPRR